MATYNGNTVTVPLTGVGDREFYATGAFSWDTKGATAYKLEVMVGIHKSSDWYNSPLSGSVAATGQTTKTFSGNTNADKAGTTATLKTYTFSWNRGKSDASKTVTVKVSRVYNGKTYTSTLSHTVTIPALASYAVKYNANGGSDAPSSQTKWYGESLTLRSNSGMTRSHYTFSKWNTKSDGSGTSYSSGGAYTANAAATMYAQWTANKYTISYNANGGSGAPASQTKTYGQTLTLSSTKPTRTNWYFRGWGTSASASSPTYQPGATLGTTAITANTPLYALWYAPRTVNFDANGGSWVSGAPASKTKVYGTALPITDTPPTRAGYTFQGWATSTDNAVVVAPNGSYTGNNATATADSVTLYAVWKPVLTLTATATRYSDASHTVEDDEGTYAVVECAWTSPVGAHPSASVSPSPESSAISGDVDGTTGTLTVELTGASADETYDVTFAMSLAASNVAQGYQAASVSTVGKVLSAIYILDFKEDTSAGILAPADEDYMLNVGGVLKADWNGAEQILGTVMGAADSANPSGLQMRDPANMPLSQDAALAASVYGDMVAVSDMSGDVRTNRAHVRFVSLPDGRQGVQIETSRRKSDGTMTHNGLVLYEAADGTRTVVVSDSAPWRNALGASSGIWPVSLGGSGMSAPTHATPSITRNTKNCSSASAYIWVWGKVAMAYLDLTTNVAISVTASGNITDTDMGTLSGYRPANTVFVFSAYEGQIMASVTSGGVITLRYAESTGAARTIAKGTQIRLTGAWVLA